MNQDGLLVVGSGQMRTGTMSLKMALQRLYGGQCYHMFEIIRKNKNHIKLWLNALDQGFLDKELSMKIFEGYFAAVDNPVAPFYKDLMHIYPNCKIILTTRDSNDWVKSVRNTTDRHTTYFEEFLIKFLFWSHGIPKFQEFHKKILIKSFDQKYELLQSENGVLKRCFEAYNEEVRRTVPKERLLEFKSKDGWGPLCRFLDMPIPDEPFPHVNKTADFNHSLKAMFLRSILRLGVLMVLIFGSVIFLYKRWSYSKG